MNRSSVAMSETESEADDLWQLHLEEIGDKLNAENDRTGFLRMVNRNHIFNASSYRYVCVKDLDPVLCGMSVAVSVKTNLTVPAFHRHWQLDVSKQEVNLLSGEPVFA